LFPIALFLSVQYAPAQEYPPLFEYTLEDLGQIPLDTSTISNRYEINRDQAAGSVTVITEEEIARHGYKTLQELLSNVVGFDEGYHIFRSLISNRGFRQDINTNYLLLIDGHRINEDAFGGFDNEHIFPLMSNIARVEVIRGPSSTLWGSSAINGIIAITTKEAEDYDESDSENGAINTSIDYEAKYKRHIFNASYAKVFENDTSLLLSAQYFNNDAPWSYIYGYGVADYTPYKKPQAQYDYMPSYKLYAKINHKNWTLLISHSRYRNVPNNITLTQDPLTKDEEAIDDKTWIELIYKKSIGERFMIENHLFYDNKKLEQISYTSDNVLFRDQHYIDRGIGVESILHYTAPTYHLLSGIYGHHKTLKEDSKTDKQVTDKNIALFSEYIYSGIPNWLFTLGGRAEYGSPRGDEYSFMPRFSVFWQANENMFVKYAYNTGALRPTLITTRNYYYTSGDDTYYAKGADKTQQSASHDLQIGYRGNTLQVTLTLFYARIDDLVLWGDQYQVGTTSDGIPILLWETNLADLEQQGIEVEWHWFPNRRVTLYGNYAYADTHYVNEWVTYQDEPILSLIADSWTDSSLTMAGAPQQTWNLGIDWDIEPNIQLNLHYHGRYGVLSIYPNPEWETYGSEHFFDTNLRWIEALGENTELDFYMKNIGNNRGYFPTGYGEVETQLGRQIGFKLNIKL